MVRWIASGSTSEEGVEIDAASETAASITYQCLFRQYKDFAA